MVFLQGAHATKRAKKKTNKQTRQKMNEWTRFPLSLFTIKRNRSQGLVYCHPLFNLLLSLSLDRSTKLLWIGNDIDTIVLHSQDYKVNVRLHHQVDSRLMFVFHSFLNGSLTVIQWLSWSDCNKKVKTTCQVTNEHSSTFHALKNQALRSCDNLSQWKFDLWHHNIFVFTSTTRR